MIADYVVCALLFFPSVFLIQVCQMSSATAFAASRSSPRRAKLLDLFQMELLLRSTESLYVLFGFRQ